MRNEQTPKDLVSVNEDQEIIVDVTDMQEGQENPGDLKKAEAEAIKENPEDSGKAEAEAIKENSEDSGKAEAEVVKENSDQGEKAEDPKQVPDVVEKEEPIDDYITGETEAEEASPKAKAKDVDIITTGRTYAGFFARLTAYLLDHLFLLIPLGIVRFILLIISAGNPDHILNRSLFFRFSPADMIIYAVSALYFILLTYITGRTLGKRIMRLKVVSAEERKPSFLEIVFRETFGRFLSAVTLCIGYLMIIIGDQKEALHDYLADTRVIYR